MPIGLVSDSDFFAELKNESNNSKTRARPLVPEIVPDTRKGRKENDVNVPDSLRKIIGETAVIDGRQSALDLANQFGISPSSVSAYAKGATSTASYNSPTSSIISHINKSRERAVKRASKTLNAALSAINQEKLDYSDAKDLSGIAKDMSVIIKNLEPQSEVTKDEKQTPQFVIFAPSFRQENTFESILVDE